MTEITDARPERDTPDQGCVLPSPGFWQQIADWANKPATRGFVTAAASVTLILAMACGRQSSPRFPRF